MSPARTAGGVFAATACLLAATAATPGRAQLPTCFDQPATIVGTDGPETLNGTDGDDVIVSLGGDDMVDGLAGNDRICAGDGGDQVIGDAGDDLLAGDGGVDVVLGYDGNDLVDGGADMDGIDGGSGDDRLFGGEGIADLVAFLTLVTPVQVDLGAGTASGHGSDLLQGFEAVAGSVSDDLLTGGEQGEFIFPRLGDDVVRGGGGFDIVAFQGPVSASLATGTATGEGTDKLAGIEGLGAGNAGARGSALTGDGHDNFLGGSPGADAFAGGGGGDLLVGADGADRLVGGSGADILAGGSGSNVLDGGGGNDIASYLASPVPIRVELARSRATGEGTDRLLRITSVAGSQFGDVIRGDALPNSLEGRGGDDRLLGLGASDFLDGGSGTDQLDGGGGRNYCVDGERRTRCQVSEQTSAPAARASSRAPAVVLARGTATPLEELLGALERPRTARRGLAPAAAATRAIPAGGSAATFADGVLYDKSVPTCTAGRRQTTSIAPPKFVNPLNVPGAQSVRWRGILRRDGRVIHRTPFADAMIAGGQSPPGWALWKDTRNRTYAKQAVPIRQAGVYSWSGEMTHKETQVHGLTRVHRHPPPPDCSFR